MQDPPTAIELLNAAREHLHAEVIPSLQDPGIRFRTLVAANVLAIVEREIASDEQDHQRELERLTRLLDETQMVAPRGGELSTRLKATTLRLRRRVAHGEFDTGPKREALLEHLKRTAVAKLRVSNPVYLAKVAKEDPSLESEDEVES